MYVTGENLLQSLTDNAAQVGQDGCPVVLVGHSLGGLVMKEILLRANHDLSLREKQNERVLFFLHNVKQLFYYSCPHNGTRLADKKTELPKGPLFKLLTTLNKKAARCNEEFRMLRVKFKWGAYSIGEQLPTDLGSLGSHVVVEEASARHDSDFYYTARADHFSVCQPTSTSAASFLKLKEVIDGTLSEDVHGHQITFSTDVVGLNHQINEVGFTLKTTQHLGICGIGGIGKSTLAKAVYNTISGNFEYTSFVSEVKDLLGDKVSTEDLQALILKDLYYKGRKHEAQWERLKGKRVLIILDDVEYESQVFVMPKTDSGVDFFSNESRLLVTSRDKRIVSSKGFKVYDAAVLGAEASKKLFCRHAFKEEHPPRAYEGHVKNFTDKCGGLPLALEVAGKYLYNQEEDVWNDAFKRFSTAKPLGRGKVDRFWSIFEVIYESLQEEEQQIFLDIAACFHGHQLEMIKRVWGCCDWLTTVNAALQNLVDIGFVTLRGERIVEIWMHEVLRDFGCSKENPGTLQSYSRLCYEGISQLPPWPFKQGTPQVKILKIAVQDSFFGGSELQVISTERLSGLKNLKVLWLENVSLRGACNLLPDNLGFLRMRSWRWNDSFESEVGSRSSGWYSTIGESSSPKPGQRPSLQHVEFVDHRDSLFPYSIFKHFQNLLHLSISDCKSLRALPKTLSQLLPGLRQVIIKKCNSLTALPATLGKLQDLEHLEVVECRKLKTLPATLGQLPSLRQLIIKECNSLGAFPDTLGNLQALEHLEVVGCNLQALPDTLGQLQRLRQLIMKNHSQAAGLYGIPCPWGPLDTLGDLEALEHLEVVGFGALPDNLMKLQVLRKFIIESCHSLKVLPDGLEKLPALKHLEIKNCPHLNIGPATIRELGKLPHFEYVPTYRYGGDFCDCSDCSQGGFGNVYDPFTYARLGGFGNVYDPFSYARLG